MIETNNIMMELVTVHNPLGVEFHINRGPLCLTEACAFPDSTLMLTQYHHATFISHN